MRGRASGRDGGCPLGGRQVAVEPRWVAGFPHPPCTLHPTSGLCTPLPTPSLAFEWQPLSHSELRGHLQVTSRGCRPAVACALFPTPSPSRLSTLPCPHGEQGWLLAQPLEDPGPCVHPSDPPRTEPELCSLPREAEGSLQRGTGRPGVGGVQTCSRRARVPSLTGPPGQGGC